MPRTPSKELVSTIDATLRPVESDFRRNKNERIDHLNQQILAQKDVKDYNTREKNLCELVTERDELNDTWDTIPPPTPPALFLIIWNLCLEVCALHVWVSGLDPVSRAIAYLTGSAGLLISTGLAYWTWRLILQLLGG